MEPWTIEEAQELTNCIALIIDPKHKYRIEKYRRTCAFVRQTFVHHHRRTIGLSHSTLTYQGTNGLIRVLLHEIAHFVHDQRYRNRLDLLAKHRAHRSSFRRLENILTSRLEAEYGEKLSVSCG